ncbi:alpha-L-rhamnosidase [Piscinibacter gummiphilus]|nr:alpha-L-rhamnosidase [Piscinibacter gummiphilus]
MVTVAGNAPSFVLSTRLDLNSAEAIKKATLHATAHGAYEVRIDGQPVSERVLAPGWTAFDSRLQVQAYDVTEFVRQGCRLEALIGNGWWRSRLGFTAMDIDYASHIGFIAELEIVYASGAVQFVATDASWTAETSQVGENSIYHGQVIDKSLSGKPLTTCIVEFDRSTLVAQVKPPVLRHEVVHPISITVPDDKRFIIDFGQNLVGWVRLRARGSAGGRIVVRHAEVLEGDALAVRPLRSARATDTFVLSGEDDLFEPTFTFHGFRYAEVTGHPGPLSAENVEAVVVHSQMRRTGHFECSNPLINRLVENSVWGQKGNFLDLPTDCPQRDERMGWTGDLAVYASSAAFQFDVADVLHGWLLDLKVELQEAGYVPFVVPNLFKFASKAALKNYAHILGPTAIWADAAAWVPEALWWAYGDAARLAEHYPAVVGHLESVLPRVSDTGLWDKGFQFGDWLDPTAPPDKPLASKSDPGVIATACLYRTLSFAALAAEQLGKPDDARRWRHIAARTRTAFQQHYLQPDGRLRSDAQAVYALAIHFGLLDPEQSRAAAARLAELVRESGYHVSTGFAGTPYVTWALSTHGFVEEAYRLVLQTDNPSWLYAVKMGATTIWERWDSLLPDGTVNPGEMTSFNHYALGAVVDWLYKAVAGIRPAQPGYQRIHLQPTPGPGLDWARATLETRHGQVTCGWRRNDADIVIECTVPQGAEADLHTWHGEVLVLGPGSYEIRKPC